MYWEPRQCSWCSDLAMSWLIRGLKSSTGKKSLSSPRCHDQLWGLSSFLFSGYWGSFLGWSGQDMKLTSHLHLALTLRMSRAATTAAIFLHGVRQLYVLPLFIMYFLMSFQVSWLASVAHQLTPSHWKLTVNTMCPLCCYFTFYKNT
jgi:hypothetical protein